MKMRKKTIKNENISVEAHGGKRVAEASIQDDSKKKLLQAKEAYYKQKRPILLYAKFKDVEENQYKSIFFFDLSVIDIFSLYTYFYFVCPQTYFYIFLL
jgi:hypothetical protein